MKKKAENILNKIPKYVYNVSDKLLDEGFEAYLVGGSVRDILIGKDPYDFDIATNAYPDDIQKIFPKSIATGAKFGTIVVVIEDEKGERFDIEVTTYRSESDYFGGRWPAKVEFSKNIEDDLSRRDFTMNAIAIDLDNLSEDVDFIESKLVDPFGGLEDIQKKLIRAVGDSKERFKEDGLRSIRACRFYSTLEFDIEKETKKAISETLAVTKMVAIERVRDEFNKMVMQSSKPSRGFRFMDEVGILKLYIPELVEGKEFYQPEYHADNVFEHSLKTLDIAEDEIKWAALLHDIGKIRTQSKDDKGTHYYGHDVEGAKMAKDILSRLRFSNSEIKRVANLIRWHMFYYPSAEWRNENRVENIDLKSLEEGKVAYGWSDAAVRRFIRNVGGLDVVDQLIKLRIADATSNEKSQFNNKEILALQERIANVVEEDMALKISDLDLSGKDLKELGYNPGPIFSKILNYLLERVLDDPTINDKQKLIEIVKEKF